MLNSLRFEAEQMLCNIIRGGINENLFSRSHGFTKHKSQRLLTRNWENYADVIGMKQKIIFLPDSFW